MKGTKQNILDAALTLFNLQGIVNVRLQHIADEAKISVGNLAYHFANKAAIVSALYDSLTQDQISLMANYRVVPLFDHIDLLIRDTFDLQIRYSFFYVDTLEILRAYESINQSHRVHIQNQINQLVFIIDFNRARGALIKEPQPEFTRSIAEQLWMTLDLWLVRNAIQGDVTPAIESFQRDVWAVLIPHFSPMGALEYRQMLALTAKS